jgi:hypothetical protein
MRFGDRQRKPDRKTQTTDEALMLMKHRNELFHAGACVFAILTAATLDGAVVTHLPGYSANSFVNGPPGGDSLDMDASGRLYAPSSNGITRYGSDGSSSVWSTAVGYSLAIASGGDGYLTTRDSGRSILHISPDGTFSPLVPSSSNLAWTWAAAGPTGTLFANVWSGSGQGLYSIDTTTGAYSILVAGGPGIGGAGHYFDMVFAASGALYVSGYDGIADGIFRLDGSSLTRVAVLPRAGLGLTIDSAGLLYTSVNDAGGFDEVWRVDVGSGEVDLVASGLGSPVGISYDSANGRLFVRDSDTPFAITAISVPEPSTYAMTLAASLFFVTLRRRQDAYQAVRGNRR